MWVWQETIEGQFFGDGFWESLLVVAEELNHMLPRRNQNSNASSKHSHVPQVQVNPQWR